MFQITLVLVCVTGVLCQTTITAECVSNVTETEKNYIWIDNTFLRFFFFVFVCWVWASHAAHYRVNILNRRYKHSFTFRLTSSDIQILILNGLLLLSFFLGSPMQGRNRNVCSIIEVQREKMQHVCWCVLLVIQNMLYSGTILTIVKTPYSHYYILSYINFDFDFLSFIILLM